MRELAKELHEMLARVLWNLGILLKSQWLSPERLRELQNRKLRALLHHAYDNVPYYRQLFDNAGVKPKDIQSVDELERIPITTKQDLQRTPIVERLSRKVNPEKCEMIRTTGSTGIPLELYRTQRGLDMRIAAEARMLLSCLTRIFPRFLGVTARTSPLGRGVFRLWPWRTKRVELSESAERIVEVIRRFKPHVLWGYPSRLHLIARAIDANRLPPISVETVLVGSEVLEPAVRKEIAHAFGAEIFETYGAFEFGRLGWECRKHTGLHLCTDAYVFELVRDGRRVEPGQTGELVVTGLDLRAMPMIRYLLGDLCALSEEPCPCGRGFPVAKALEGRTDDMLLLPDGKLLSPRSFAAPIYNLPGVRQFRVVQDKRDRIIIEIIRGVGFPADGAERIQHVYKNRYPGLKANVRFVSHIPHDPSGKLRKIISLVGPPSRSGTGESKLAPSTGKRDAQTT